jgi:hypothetical protein
MPMTKSFRVSRMREIRTSGLKRGEAAVQDISHCSSSTRLVFFCDSLHHRNRLPQRDHSAAFGKVQTLFVTRYHTSSCARANKPGHLVNVTRKPIGTRNLAAGGLIHAALGRPSAMIHRRRWQHSSRRLLVVAGDILARRLGGDLISKCEID